MSKQEKTNGRGKYRYAERQRYPPAPSKKCEMREGSGKGWLLAGSAGSGSFLPSWTHRHPPFPQPTGLSVLFATKGRWAKPGLGFINAASTFWRRVLLPSVGKATALPGPTSFFRAGQSWAGSLRSLTRCSQFPTYSVSYSQPLFLHIQRSRCSSQDS